MSKQYLQQSPRNEVWGNNSATGFESPWLNFFPVKRMFFLVSLQVIAHKNAKPSQVEWLTVQVCQIFLVLIRVAERFFSGVPQPPPPWRLLPESSFPQIDGFDLVAFAPWESW